MGVSGGDFTSWNYDLRGRVTSENKQIPGGGQFITGFTYNAADLPESMTYPDGEVVHFTYNDRMLVDAVFGSDVYVLGTNYDSAGRVIWRGLGQRDGETAPAAPASGWTIFAAPLVIINTPLPPEPDVTSIPTSISTATPTRTPTATPTLIPSPTATLPPAPQPVLVQTYTYYPWDTPAQGGRLQNLAATRSIDQEPLQNLDYVYDPVGNIQTITDSVNPSDLQTQTFQYDELDRLTNSSVTGGTNGIYAEGYTYESDTGNLGSKNN